MLESVSDFTKKSGIMTWQRSFQIQFLAILRTLMRKMGRTNCATLDIQPRVLLCDLCVLCVKLSRRKYLTQRTQRYAEIAEKTLNYQFHLSKVKDNPNTFEVKILSGSFELRFSN